ncbi:NUDIX hydrolase [Rubellicoccus peritrichatus]|uniref:NUDIX domain-containing protein n=1 Tax=Rubellicoccus peritrichatus TaxID=3080537 RepID=A0AAQ3LEY2_9BACT|nr:NUDIX domain-containing protein [Puniceicoccus sp. CR14]WOO42418.1 NUDIX domain-containing protein [Puniceicoccus sp. CR14]
MNLPFKISVLVFLHSEDGKLLMIERRKAPNMGCWSPIGGKLEMDRGESPFECAIREVGEEAELSITKEDLHLWGYVSEKHFEGEKHWLMFMFDCKKPLKELPKTIDEGNFAFYTREEIDEIKVPPTDRDLIWPYYDSHRDGFIALRADCHPEKDLKIVVEESIGI